MKFVIFIIALICTWPASAGFEKAPMSNFLDGCYKKIISTKNQNAPEIVACKKVVYSRPEDFRATCEQQDGKIKAYFVWDKKTQNLIITGDAISGDNGYLRVRENGDLQTELFTSYEILEASEILQSSKIIRWRMSFWYGLDNRRDVRAFEFQITPSLKGAATATSFKVLDKVINPMGTVYLSNCKFDNIPY